MHREAVFILPGHCGCGSFTPDGNLFLLPGLEGNTERPASPGRIRRQAPAVTKLYALSVNEAAQTWSELSSPWQAAFDEAWMSWRHGSLGVGAAVTDETGQIVARGHNQFFHKGPGPISTTSMAHAEMNALAQLPVGHEATYNLYSTFEPCYMCTSALHFYRVEHVAFAAADPVWLGMHEWLQSAPWASRNESTRECLRGELGAFGYVLHVSKLAKIAPPYVLEAHQQQTRLLFEFALGDELLYLLDGFAALDSLTTTDEVLAALWDDLVQLKGQL